MNLTYNIPKSTSQILNLKRLKTINLSGNAKISNINMQIISKQVRYIHQSSNIQHQSPFTKSCFRKSRLTVNTHYCSNINNNQPNTAERRKSNPHSQIPHYRYKSNQKLLSRENSLVSRQSSLGKSSFLRCCRVKKDKIPVNFFAQQSVIKGQISSAFVKLNPQAH